MHNVTGRSPRGARVLAAALPVAAALSLLAGCAPKKDGATGRSPSPSPTAQPLTRDQYVKEATAICQAHYPSPIPRPGTAADLVKGVKDQIAGMKALQAKLRALPPPEADKEELEGKFLAARDKQIAAFEDVLPDVEKAAATGDLNAAATALTPGAQEAVNQAADSAPFTDSYGLHVCHL